MSGKEAVSIGLSAAILSYSMIGNALPGSPPIIMAVQGSLAVRAVTLAPSRLASSMPLVTALAARSDPSVAIRMCLYMSISLFRIDHGLRAAARP